MPKRPTKEGKAQMRNEMSSRKVDGNKRNASREKKEGEEKEKRRKRDGEGTQGFPKDPILREGEIMTKYGTTGSRAGGGGVGSWRGRKHGEGRGRGEEWGEGGRRR